MWEAHGLVEGFGDVKPADCASICDTTLRNDGKNLPYSCPALRTLSWVFALLVALCSTSMPVQAMGNLSDYTKAIFDCPGLRIGSWGPKHSGINTASMEPVDICLYDLDTHRGLKLKIPAAYIKAINKGDRAHTTVFVDVWMPGFQPESAVSALRDPDPKSRLQYLKDNRKNLLQITLTSKSNLSAFGHSEEYLQQFREKHRWTTFPDWGFERYQDDCESLSSLKREGRDLSTRKCTVNDFYETFVGRSSVVQGMTLVLCRKNTDLCTVYGRFEDMSLEFNILRTELPRIKEYEQDIDQFLRKYFVEKLPSRLNK